MASLYLVTGIASRNALQKRFRRGELTRVRKGIYADTNDEADIKNTILSEWVTIATYLFEDAVAVFRTAAELKPFKDRVYLMVAEGARRTVAVGPLKLTIESGVVDQGVEPFHPDMNRSNLHRQLLENLTLSRAKSGSKKTLGQDWVETQLIEEMQRRGEVSLNQLRDEASVLAPIIELEKENKVLNKMISAILKTYPKNGILQTQTGIAFAAGESFDRERVELFNAFSSYLAKVELSAQSYHYDNARWRNLAFFESYFSNYIEGTQFTLDEAEDIISSGKAAYGRHEDSHDILAHMEITADHNEMTRVPNSAAELIDILKVRHSILLAARRSKRPGQFKEIENRAGATLFVSPEILDGTLIRGFDLYKVIPEGIKRALFMHFLIAECHPFDDGNGRMARIMMNAELVATDLHKTIVPTVCRENYLGGLRLASRNNRFRIIVKVLHQLHQYTASIQWQDYGDARSTLEKHAADKEANEGLMIFNKILSQYKGDYQAD